MIPRKLRVLAYLVLLLPFDILVGFSLLAAAASSRLLLRRRMPGTAKLPPERLATIQILNWDGKHLLEECLPSVVDAVRTSGKPHRILVVDNGSTDGSVQFVKERFPGIDVLELDQNYGYVGGNNRGINHVTTDIVILLNNDMIVDEHFVEPLLEGFSDDSVFGVTSQVFFEDVSRRRVETGKTRAKFKDGFFTFWHADIDDADASTQTLPVFWAGGGSCAFDRTKFKEIGGFDVLYHPFYVEDVDVSYQAWKRGWRCLLAPASRVIHKHRATSGRKYTIDFVENTTRRNMFLFVWKNVTDWPMLVQHVFNLPRIHGRSMLMSGARFEVRAYGRALLLLLPALRKRLLTAPYHRMSDVEVLVRSQQ